MKYGTKLLTVSCGTCLVLLFASPIWAQRSRGGGGGGGPMQQAAPPSPKATSPEQQAYDKAAKALADVVAKAKTDFERGNDWTSAEADLHKAQAELDAARQAAAADLAGNDDYQQALKDRKQAQADLDAAKASGSPPEDLTPLATKMMMVNSKISQLEHTAADNNPGVKAAKDKVKTASAALDQLKQQFEDSLKGNADWVTAKQAVDTAAAALPTPPEGSGTGGKPSGPPGSAGGA